MLLITRITALNARCIVYLQCTAKLTRVGHMFANSQY